MRGYGGTFSFKIQGGQDEAFRALSGLRVFTLAESLGGVESLIEHPATMTHASMPADVRAAMGITANLIRISVGLEDSSDLIEDLDSALQCA
jgi:cystathionine gamma-lyase